MSSVEGSSEDLEEEVLELDLEWIQQSRINGPCILRSARCGDSFTRASFITENIY